MVNVYTVIDQTVTGLVVLIHSCCSSKKNQRSEAVIELTSVFVKRNYFLERIFD
jgi:hypothetical protein